MNHHNNFDLLRLFAALQVAYMHSVALLQLPRGGALFDVLSCVPGVPLFFVISGFLVTDSYLRSKNVGDYFLRRALRIYPALVVNLIVIDLAMYFTGGLAAVQWPAQYAASFGIVALTASHEMGLWVTQIPALYSPSSFFSALPSGVLWTLTVELSFYLMLPIILTLYLFDKRAGFAFAAALAVASLALAGRANTVTTHPFADPLIGRCFWIFALGVLARLTWSWTRQVFEGKLLIWLAAYAAVTFALIQLREGSTALDYKTSVDWVVFVRVALMAGLLLSAAYSFKSASAVLRGNDLSYAIYLYHVFIIYCLIGFGLMGKWWLWLVVYGCTAAVAAISWLIVERPALRLKKQTWSGRMAGVQVGALPGMRGIDRPKTLTQD